MSEPPSVYFDHGATTPLRPEVAQAMAAARAEPLGNPTGSHRPAQRARRLIEEARDEVAAYLGRAPGEIIFTSGGTESANLAVFGVLEAAGRDGRPAAEIVCSAVEHPAVRQSCRAAARWPAVTCRVLPVDEAGCVDVDALTGLLSAETALVAVMLANNETGVVQPLDRVADAVALAGNARLFTDAVQASAFVSLAETTSGADLVALSAHKVGGPVGVGALAVRPPADLVPRQYGGGQEHERRSGTQDVVGAVGLAVALRLAAVERSATVQRVGALRDRLAAGLAENIPGLYRSVPPGVDVLPGHLHVCLPGIEREELLVALSERGVCASGGSSCASGALEPSYVLAAMGVPDNLARGAIRFTLGHDTTEADVECALAIVPGVVASLRHDP